MRLWRLPTNTGIHDLTLAEAPIPEPGPGQVLVRLHAAALNSRDVAVARGKYLMSHVPPNLVPLSDGAGEIVRTGPGVTRWREGDRVAGIFMQTWLGGEFEAEHGEAALGGAIDGVLAEYRVFPEAGLVRVPPHLDFHEAATLPCAAVTAWNALYGGKPLLPGQTVLVLGTGGVSMFALQFARAGGARVIATSGSDAKLERARQHGATATINYRTHEDWNTEVRRLTHGRGADHVIEIGGPGTLQRSIAAAGFGASITLIGVLTRGQIDPVAILGGGVAVRGIFVGNRQMFEAMNRAMEQNEIHPIIDRVFPFEEAKAAYHHLQTAQHIGKIVIQISGN